MNSLLENRIPPALRLAVFRYLSERLEAPIISTAEAVRSIMKETPECEVMTSQELANLIAEIAIEAGFDINFDGTGTMH